MMNAILKRELLAYFRSPVAYVYMVIFLVASSGCAFFLGHFFEGNQASLEGFFLFLPWILMVLIPAIAMRLWAEERRSGTIELLLTLPVTIGDAVVAKFLAAWVFLGLNLLLTFPMVITVNYLGSPDNGVIFAGYVAAWLLAASFIGVTSVSSALTKNQVISFVLAVVVNFALVLMGWGIFGDFLGAALPQAVVDAVARLGVMPHYTQMVRGVIDTRDALFFLSLVALSLAGTAWVLNVKKAH